MPVFMVSVPPASTETTGGMSCLWSSGDLQNDLKISDKAVRVECSNVQKLLSTIGCLNSKLNEKPSGEWVTHC